MKFFLNGEFSLRLVLQSHSSLGDEVIGKDSHARAWESGLLTASKPTDIRGLSGDELSDEFAYRLGRAMATYLECESFAVGRILENPAPVMLQT